MKQPKLKWWMYFSIGAYIAGWIGRSFADNKISIAEQKELISAIFEMVGADIEIEKL